MQTESNAFDSVCIYNISHRNLKNSTTLSFWIFHRLPILKPSI